MVFDFLFDRESRVQGPLFPQDVLYSIVIGGTLARYSPYSTLYTLFSILYTLYFILYSPYLLLHTIHSTLVTLYSLLNTQHSILYTRHSILHNPYYTLYTRYSILYALTRQILQPSLNNNILSNFFRSSVFCYNSNVIWLRWHDFIEIKA